MNQPGAVTLTLFDLLARRWRAAAAIADLRVSADGAAVAFAAADGTLLIAGSPDPEPPDTRIRITGDLGQLTIRPRNREAPPLVALAGLAGAAPPIAADGPGFLAGDGEGRVLRVTAEGAAEPVLTLGSAVAALDHAPGVIAAADAEGLVRQDRDGARRWPAPGLCAVALSPAGTRLAAAGPEQILLVEEEFSRARPLAGAARLAWRGDGAWLAAATGQGLGLIPARGEAEPLRIGGFPGHVRSLGWSAVSQALVASGAFRVAAWDAAALPETDRPLLAGQAGLVLVEAVAPHPTRPLVAAGYANGQVVIARIGGRDELMLRQDGAPVTCLGWSPDGRHLALGDAAGEIAIATFPPQIFK